MTRLYVEPFIIGWIATFDHARGPIGFGESPEEARANLIALIAHSEPHDLRTALGELATSVDLLAAVRLIDQLIHECDTKARIAGPLNWPEQQRYHKAADKWQRAVNTIGRVAGVAP